MYLYAKAIHIIFVICWMAGLFYMVRLFIYHTEAKLKSKVAYDVLHEEYQRNERLLWWVIATPSMYLTIIAGAIMLYLNPAWLQQPWMHVKLILVLGLIIYHFICQRILFRLSDETNRWTSIQLRLWNELATVLLFAIVFVVVLKSAVNWIYGVIGLVLFAVILMMAVKLYKRIRERK
ncbi:CopD family protein [Olivibacter sp. SDN3]|uniref:CopD family protein n=1 Tax=Olivibacter sp. SDN3 TaxID=2764720 RepID=UPI0016511BDC|nr:CopD family protein [Olivibacter sp. SDN3]QNL49990.1 CopD family protein [Olivibacter sp. SDN3]